MGTRLGVVESATAPGANEREGVGVTEGAVGRLSEAEKEEGGVDRLSRAELE